MIVENRIKIQIKGVRDGLLVTLGEGDWPEIETALLQHIDERASFFQGARVALEVGNHILHAAELGTLRDKLSDKGVALWAVLSNSPTTEQTAQILGMATQLSAPRPERRIKTLDTELTGDEAMLIQRTLRSGFKVSFAGHVVVIGDVNPGAEIIAGGSVIVWGKVKGMVHAGAEGDQTATVCALELSPTQLRISEFIAVTPRRKGKLQPEMAKIVDGQVIAEAWDYKKREENDSDNSNHNIRKGWRR